jgi:hypothetical protein
MISGNVVSNDFRQSLTLYMWQFVTRCLVNGVVGLQEIVESLPPTKLSTVITQSNIASLGTPGLTVTIMPSKSSTVRNNGPKNSKTSRFSVSLPRSKPRRFRDTRRGQPHV